MAESSNLDGIVVEQQVIERGMEDIDMDPLYKAISDNDWPAAEAFVKSHPVGLGRERMVQGWVGLPVQWAIFVGHKEMGRYLYKFTPPHLFKEHHDRASSFLTLCLTNGVLDIALDLLKISKELLFAKVDNFHSTIEYIAIQLPDSSLDKSQLLFWKRWVYDSTVINRLHRLISNVNNLSGMKEIYQMKQQHAQAAQILNLICENVKSLNEDTKSMTQDTLIAAAKMDKVEFLVQVTRANPEIILTGSFDLFFDAVRYRRTLIFNLFRGFSSKHLVAEVIDKDENEIKLLHLAASLAPSSYRKQVSGAALQLQQELQWFKAAESMVDPAFLNLRHRMNLLASQKQPLDHFKDNHRELRKEGERWLQNTATSFSIFGTLILTIMFTAAFTVPGGNHQDLGYPILLEHKLFKVFLISDALSLFSVTTSVLTFLGILMSHYEEEDFLYSLPIKLIIGLSTLFLSIATMTVAFSVTIIIMLQHSSSRLRAILLIAVLAGIPIISFVS